MEDNKSIEIWETTWKPEIHTDVANDTNFILTPKNEHASLNDIINIVENLSEDAQRKLLDIAGKVRPTSPRYRTAFSKEITELLDSQIIVDVDPLKHKYKFGTKSDIMEFLDNENIPYYKKAPKYILQETCIKYAPQKTREKFYATLYVGIPTKFSAPKIYYYLHRKYDYEIYYDEMMNEQRVRLLDTDLPDDDVTDQLIKCGYYLQK